MYAFLIDLSFMRTSPKRVVTENSVEGTTSSVIQTSLCSALLLASCMILGKFPHLCELQFTYLYIGDNDVSIIEPLC